MTDFKTSVLWALDGDDWLRIRVRDLRELIESEQALRDQAAARTWQIEVKADDQPANVVSLDDRRRS